MFEAPPRKTPDVGLTPLIDVVFILLIFVVIAANFDRIRGLKVELPKAESVQQTPNKPLILSVSEKGAYQLDGRDLSRQELPLRLEVARKQHKDLVIRADSKVALQHAIFALDLASKLRFASVSIAAQDLRLPTPSESKTPQAPSKGDAP